MEASTQPKSVEVSYDQALAEENGDQPQGQAVRPAPQRSPEAEAAKQQAEETIDLLAPKRGARQWSFGKDKDGNPVVTYTQRELSVITKTQWFSLVGEFLDDALGGDNPISLNTLLAPPPGVRPGQFSISDFQDADTFVQAIGKLLIKAPDFLVKSICIWLAVPDYEWELAETLMKQSPDLGGLSDEMAEEIFATFIDQNFIAINNFFRERFGRIRARYQARAREAEQSRSQKH